MESKRPPWNEAARDRAASILHTQSLIRLNIWGAVSERGYRAYHRLSAAIYAGVKIDEFFVAQEGETIEAAFPVLGAHLQQVFVDRTIAAMPNLNRSAPGENHAVILFPPIKSDDNTGTITEEKSVVDVLKVVPGQFAKVVSAAADIARMQVANTVVQHDSISRQLGINTPLLYLPFIVDDFSVITVPTTIKRVYLRYTKRKNNPNILTEFVMEAL